MNELDPSALVVNEVLETTLVIEGTVTLELTDIPDPGEDNQPDIFLSLEKRLNPESPWYVLVKHVHYQSGNVTPFALKWVVARHVEKVWGIATVATSDVTIVDTERGGSFEDGLPQVSYRVELER